MKISFELVCGTIASQVQCTVAVCVSSLDIAGRLNGGPRS